MITPSESLCIADERTFWPRLAWPEFAALPERPRTLVIQPIAGLADWGLGHALDSEETVLMETLRRAMMLCPPPVRALVLPPLRFVTGPHENCAFPVSPAIAHAQLEEIACSVSAASFRRIVLLNASPWNEDLCDVAARDLRIDHGLEMFCIHLRALGLDFQPARGNDRAALTAVLDALAKNPSATVAAETHLAEASAHLVRLLAEIHAHPQLPDKGAIRNATAP